MRSDTYRTSIFMALMLIPFAAWTGAISDSTLITHSASARDGTAWYGDEGWGQFRHNPTHNSTMPPHSVDGGPNDGPVENVTSLLTIDDPLVNWNHHTNSHYGADGFGTVIGDFSASISAPAAASQRCGQGLLFAVMVSTQNVGGESHSILSIIDGGSGKIAWEVDLGVTIAVKSAPAVVDVDSDGMPEIVVAYDSDSSVNLDLYSPRLTCSESGWVSTGHSSELLWTWNDADMRLGSESPHFAIQQSNHLVSTQLLVADLQMDGGLDAVLALIDQDTGNPTIKAIQLSVSGPPDPSWSVALDRGTHVSDPTWVALDDLNAAILLTTIDANNGNMWVWRIAGASGSLDWERISLTGTQTDADPVHLRVPGPVIAQLDDDAAPEVIFTIPSDQNGRTNGNGATFVAWDLTSTDELWRFRAPNGYADAAPLAVDEDGDGTSDRLCWVTWYSTSSLTFERQGLAGCHDITDEPISKLFSRTMDSSSGNDNDEIAASAPLAIDIDGSGAPELVVGFGRRVYAFDGDSGTSAEINSHWATPLSVPHRTWSAPAAGDLDGDGALDLLIGDTLVSRTVADAAPTSDSRGITFNPEQPDPGATVTISAQYSNIGTTAFEGGFDAVLYLGGVEIGRDRAIDLEPVAPSGNGGPVTFSVDIVATRGVHEVQLVLDPLSNHTQAREDNDQSTTYLEVLDPYVVEISAPLELTRILPGGSADVIPTVTATGRKAAQWSMSLTEHLPDGWTMTDSTPGGSQMVELEPDTPWNPVIKVTVPENAEGSESGHISMQMVLDEDQNVTFNATIPIEVLRTQGLSIQGPDGLAISHGSGRKGHDASAWFMVENLGNAYETSSSITWNQNGWLIQPRIIDEDGNEITLIELAPGETREFIAKVEVPTDSVSLGDSVNNNLEICIGSSSDTLCRDIDFRFTANGLALSPPHIRDEPQNPKSWQIQVSKPGGADLSWDLGSAGLLKEGWTWSTGGDLELVAGVLSTTPGPSPAVGWLNLTIPGITPPDLHIANISAQGELFHDLNLSLHVLQVHRSDISLSEEIAEPWAVDVAADENDEGDRLILRLENPGNGLDSYQLTGHVIPNENFSSNPGVTFLIPNPQRNLSAGAVVHVPVNVSLSADIPARVPIHLRFTLGSTMLTSVEDSIDVMIQARPDHRWDLQLNGSADISAIPKESISFQFMATNTGNSMDHLSLSTRFDLNAVSGDNSEWQFSGTSLEDIATSESAMVWVNTTVPDDAWNGSEVSLLIDVYAEDVLIETISASIVVGHLTGWGFNLSNTSLEIDPEGGAISVRVEQRGNHPTRPWFTLVMPEWNLTYPETIDAISPGESTVLQINVTPPQDGLAGEVSLLRIRARESDGGGLGEVSVPLRIGAEHAMELHSANKWQVTLDGGMPLVWLENKGNALSNVAVSITGLPDGWSTSGSDTMVIAAGEKVGLDIDLDPADDWNGNNVLVSIIVDADGGIHLEHDISVQLSNSSWNSSPLLNGMQNDEVGVSLYGDVSSFTLSDSSIAIRSADGTWWLTLPSSAADLQATVVTSGGTDTLEMHIEPTPATSRSISCSIINGVADTLGGSSHNTSATIASCDVVNSSTPLRATLILLTDNGEILHSQIINAPIDEGMTVNISSDEWEGGYGEMVLEIRALDSHGRLLSSDSRTVIIRPTGWNIGIAYVEERSSGGLRIGILRSGQDILEGVDCRLTLSSSDWESSWALDVVSSDYAPILDLPRPPVKDGEKVDAVISCEIPFDSDDEPSDDSDSIVLATQTIDETMDSGLIWGSGVAIVVLMLMWWAGLLVPAAKTQHEVTAAKKKTAKSLPPTSATESIGDSDDSLHLEGQTPTPDDRISLIEIEQEEKAVVEEKEKLSPGDDVRQRIKELRASARAANETTSDDGDDLDKRIDDLFSRRSKES